MWIKAKDMMGNYSQNAASTSITVLYPSGYTDKNTFTTDYSGGTHNNTEYYDHATYGRILRVTAGNLSGNWTSPSNDVGSIRDMRYWITYILVHIGDETTWQGRYSSGAWNTYDTTATWSSIFRLTQASLFEIEFYYSDDNTNWSAPVKYFHIFAYETNARYVKYKIKITNISADIYMYVKPTTLKATYWN